MFNVVVNNEQYDEYLTQKEKIKELEARIKETDVLKAQIDYLYEHYQQALSDKAALIKERDQLTNVVHQQGFDIINLNKAIIKDDTRKEAKDD
jgi:ribosome-associated toxin RatA of RatAB toxin-antitoxin module